MWTIREFLSVAIAAGGFVLPACGDDTRSGGTDAGADADGDTDADADTDTNACGDGEIWDVDCGAGCELCDDGNNFGGDYCDSDCSTSGWHAFYGSGSGEDGGCSVAADASGNIYVSGYSSSSWVGPGSENPLHAWSGDGDLFVLKLSSSGDYRWHTFYGGGSGTGSRSSVAVDAGGDVYVSGYPSATWDGPGGESPLHEHSGSGGLYVLKLSSDGEYQWHTFYGCGSDNGEGNPLALDASGGVYVTGHSYDTWSGPGDAAPLHEHSGYGDAHIVKLNSNGEYQWHTFYGSDHWDYGNAIAVDVSGNVYVTGESNYSWNGPGGEYPRHPGNTTSLWADFFVLKLASNGEYQWHTFYGYIGDDSSAGIATDSGGHVYVIGASEGQWYEAPTPLHGYFEDAGSFVLKLTGDGMYGWHTFYGSGAPKSIAAVAGVLVAGVSNSGWIGPDEESPLHAHSGNVDLFVLEMSSSGSYQWHTFFGSPSTDTGESIAATDGDGIYVAGMSEATWSGPSGESPLHEHSGSVDIAVLKLAR